MKEDYPYTVIGIHSFHFREYLMFTAKDLKLACEYSMSKNRVSRSTFIVCLPSGNRMTIAEQENYLKHLTKGE